MTYIAYYTDDAIVKPTSIDVAIAAVIPYRLVCVDTNAGDISRIIREINSRRVNVTISGPCDEDIVDAILSHPNRTYGLIIQAPMDIRLVERIIGGLTSLPMLFITEPSISAIEIQLPQSIEHLVVWDGQAGATFMRNLPTMTNLKTISIRHDHALAVYTPEWIGMLIEGIAAMRRLQEIVIQLPLSIDPIPIITAMPPSIRMINVYCLGLDPKVEEMSIDRFIQGATHDYPNLEMFSLGIYWRSDVDVILKRIRGTI